MPQHPNARKARAHAVATHTGVSYAAALRHVLATETDATGSNPGTVTSPKQRLHLRTGSRTDLVGGVAVDLEAHALLDIDPDDGCRYPMLLLTAQLVSDAGTAFEAILELGLYLQVHGIHPVDNSTPARVCPWRLHITNHPSRAHIDLYTGLDNDPATQRLDFSVTMPTGWVAAAGTLGFVDILIGACTRHWDLVPVPQELADRVAPVFGPSEATWPCRCVQLDADDLVRLADSHTFLSATLAPSIDDPVPF